jgi:glycosyltransferase involved in cell wall biosynthesis
VSSARVCLNMIVRDEAHIIVRCLQAARPLIDYWVIVDTGSVDGTQDIIRSYFSEIPGELHQQPWTDFATARNYALELARGRADRLLFLDADDLVSASSEFTEFDSEVGAYYLRIRAGDDMSFERLNLVDTRLPWLWVGPVHEVVICSEPHRVERLCGWSIHSLSDGNRSRDPVGKFLRDAAVLARAVTADPTNTRNVFYLAQCYRDAGQLEQALLWYQRRVDMGGWDEEVWYSLLQIAVLHDRMQNWDRALPAYLAAYQYKPDRAEPLCDLARHYRLTGKYSVAFLFAASAVQIRMPEDILFVDEGAYTWRALDEYAISAYWIGKYEEALRYNDRLLNEGYLPNHERTRIESNRDFCLTRLSEMPDTSVTSTEHKAG